MTDNIDNHFDGQEDGPLSFEDAAVRAMANAEENRNRHEAIRVPKDLRGHPLWDRKNVMVFDLEDGPTWDSYDESEQAVFRGCADTMRIAYAHACQSQDPSTQNAALIYNSNERGGVDLVSFGINSLIPGWSAEESETIRSKRDLRLPETVHAETAAIFQAVNQLRGDRLAGSWMYCPWAACYECAKDMVCANLQQLYVHVDRYGEDVPGYSNWSSDILEAFGLFSRVNLKVIGIRGRIDTSPVLVSGERRVW